MDLGSAVLSAELALDLLDPELRDRVVLCARRRWSRAWSWRLSSRRRAGPGRPRSRPRPTGALAAKQSQLAAGARRGRTSRPTPPTPDRRLSAATFTVAQPARPARPARRRGWFGRRAPFDARRRAAQPHHGVGAGAGAQPVPGGHARRAGRAPGGGVGDRAEPRPARSSTHRRARRAAASTSRGSRAATGRPPSRGGRGPLRGVARHRGRPRPAVGAGRRRRARRAGRPVRTPNGDRLRDRDRRRPRRDRARSGAAPPATPGARGGDLRRPPAAARRRRPAGRRARRGSPRAAAAPGLGRCGGRLGRREFAALADPYLRERAPTSAPVGEQVLARAGRRRRRRHRGRRRPGRRRPHPRPGRRPRPGPGRRPRAGVGQPDRAQRDPGAGPGHPGRGRGRRRTCWPSPTAPSLALDGSTGELVVDPDDASAGRLRASAPTQARRAAEAARAARPAPALTARRGRGRGRGERRLVSTTRRRPRRTVPTGRAGAHGVPLPRSRRRAGRRRAGRGVPRDRGGARRRSGSPCARSTSAATSRCPTCRRPPRPTRSWACAASGSRWRSRQLLARPARGHRRGGARDAGQRDVPDGVSALDELVEARRRARRRRSRRSGEAVRPGLRSASWSRCRPRRSRRQPSSPHVDFFSIGTNDLTQYALAAERGNAAVAALADALDPGVLAPDRRGVPGGGRRPARGRVRRAGQRCAPPLDCWSRSVCASSAWRRAPSRRRSRRCAPSRQPTMPSSLSACSAPPPLPTSALC